MKRADRFRCAYRSIPFILLFSILCVSSGELSAQSFWRKSWEATKHWIAGIPYAPDSIIEMNHSKQLMGGGVIGILDQYLSPIAHTGPVISFLSLSDAPRKGGSRWHLFNEIDIKIGQPLNAANKSSIYIISSEYASAISYEVFRKWGLIAEVAPMLRTFIQGNIKISNVNNIVNLKAGIGLDSWGRLRYHFPSDLFPFALQYSIALPVGYLSFHPQYGQSYFEYESAKSKLLSSIRFTSLHNRQAIKQRFLIDLPIRHLTLTLGVEHSYWDEWINSTKFQQGNLQLLCGFSLDLFTISGNRSLRSKVLKRALD